MLWTSSTYAMQCAMECEGEELTPGTDSNLVILPSKGRPAVELRLATLQASGVSVMIEAGAGSSRSVLCSELAHLPEWRNW